MLFLINVFDTSSKSILTHTQDTGRIINGNKK